LQFFLNTFVLRVMASRKFGNVKATAVKRDCPALFPSPRRRDEEERRQRVMVITEFAAGDPEATMHALADEKGHDVDDYSDPDAYRGCFACFVR